jgi:hypothetical protein
MIKNSIILKPSSIARVLGMVTFMLAIASVVGQFALYYTEHRNLLGFVPAFYLDEPVSIPTFFHVSILFMAAIPLWGIFLLKKKLSDHYASRWALLSFGFVIMSYDLATGLHRKLSAPMHAWLGSSKNVLFHASNNLGIFRYAWVIPYFVIAIACCLYFFKFWLSLPNKTRNKFLISAILLLSGALGFEFLEGNYTLINGEHNFMYAAVLVTIDKSLQMGGIIYFIYAQLEYIADTYKEIQLRFG